MTEPWKHIAFTTLCWTETSTCSSINSLQFYFSFCLSFSPLNFVFFYFILSHHMGGRMVSHTLVALQRLDTFSLNSAECWDIRGTAFFSELLQNSCPYGPLYRDCCRCRKGKQEAVLPNTFVLCYIKCSFFSEKIPDSTKLGGHFLCLQWFNFNISLYGLKDVDVTWSWCTLLCTWNCIYWSFTLHPPDFLYQMSHISYMVLTERRYHLLEWSAIWV